MNTGNKSLSINETYILESIDNADVLSACTALYTSAIISCSGNTAILLNNGIISFNGYITAPVISGGTFYGDGSHLTGLSTQDTFVTGGTYSNGIATFTNNTGGTFNVSGFYTGYTVPTDVFVTGGTFDSISEVATFINNTGGTFSVTGFVNTYTTGVTFNTNVLTIHRNDGVDLTTNIDSFGSITATTYYGDGSNLTGISTKDIYVTGGTYNNGITIFTNNSGGTFSVSGYSTGYTLTSTGITSALGYIPYDSTNPNNYISGITFSNVTTALGYTPLSAYTNTYVTGGTYSNNTFTYKNNTGGTFSVLFNTMTGLTATSISATTYYGLPKDITITGGSYFDGSTTFINNTGGTFNIVGPSNYNAGVINNAEYWTENGDGSINLPQIKVGLFNNPNYIEPLIIYSIASGTTGIDGIPPLNNNDTNYIIIEYNNGSPRYNILDNDGTVNGSSIVLFMIVYRANNFVHTLEFSNMGAGLSNKLNNRVIATDRFARESGCSLSLSANTGIVVLSSGIVWNGPNRQILNSVNSNGLFFKNFHSGGTWIYTTSGHTINNNFYDNGTDLVAATPSKYLVNWYYRGQEIHDHLYEVISNSEYDSIQLAEASNEPNIPELITSHAFLVGRIIIGVNTNIGIIQSAFNTVFQPSGAPALHNDLSGIQGGVAGEYYHLDSNKYNNLALTNTDNNFTTQQTFNSSILTNSISATTYENLPLDITVTGGTYTAGTATFTNNSGGTFSVSGFNDVFVRNKTYSTETTTITVNQSIFNPSNLNVLNTSIFIIDTDADYYVLGDLTNNGVLVVNGTLKIGGELYNYGTITGSGIIE